MNETKQQQQKNEYACAGLCAIEKHSKLRGWIKWNIYYKNFNLFFCY